MRTRMMRYVFLEFRVSLHSFRAVVLIAGPFRVFVYQELTRRTALGAGVEKISRHKDHLHHHPGTASNPASPDPTNPAHPHSLGAGVGAS